MHRNQQAQMQPNFFGVCWFNFKKHIDAQQEYYRPPHTGYWSNFVHDLYDTRAVEKLCVDKCKDIQMCKNPICMEVEGYARKCNICGSSSNRIFEANHKSLPHVLESKYQTGLMSDVILYGTTREEFLPNGNFLLESRNTVRHMKYADFTVVYEGTLGVVFNKINAKILSWNFCAKNVQVLVPGHQISKYMVCIMYYSTAFSSTTAAILSEKKTIFFFCFEFFLQPPGVQLTRSVAISVGGFEIYAAIYGVDIDSHIDRFGLPRLYTRSFMLDNFVPSNDNDTGSRPTANLIALIDKRQEGN
ncbi:PREDICTED: probable transcriptional regulator SLK3 isoform X2 [Erythranthe guttata]|uniref:probable transcriptional regulator SLK3 isoform X2 n=1 Tax=Erythranthe guttata TaxID=4155 RepID=UPI00064DEA32|nr:PREDICTED: probable transcriptional regulator SLK3 isoform X2 [Erythranthe guttata]|eukprot:XP_012843661.1 PREDICTED: probable transcriptional regulator SLK3 isoform X2 [Erythranthe guttata]